MYVCMYVCVCVYICVIFCRFVIKVSNMCLETSVHIPLEF